MAGIYIHVPYCQTRCIYCDFFTQTNLSSRLDYVSALCKEIELRRNYIDNEIVRTIYFGGGTPSLLDISEIERILNVIYSNFEIDTDVEITLEANPDDLSDKYIRELKEQLFTRLSIGIQSFDDSHLKFLNRRHTAQDGINVVRAAQHLDFDNISIDLMYGLPNQMMNTWKKTLETAISLNIQHISSYHLIYEEGTKLFKLLEKGRVNEVDEDLSLEMFSTMISVLADSGFDHYEISNFSKDSMFSKHNTSYWLGEKYLGLGSSAHSYDGKDRAFNIHSISKYIDGIDNNSPSIELEHLNINSQYNDFVLTGLRTKWGVDIDVLNRKFGDEFVQYCLLNVEKYILSENVIREYNKIKLTPKGIFISDSIMSDLMRV